MSFNISGVEIENDDTCWFLLLIFSHKKDDIILQEITSYLSPIPNYKIDIYMEQVTFRQGRTLPGIKNERRDDARKRHIICE